MEIFSNPIVDTLFPVRGILVILISLFPPDVTSGTLIFSVPMLVGMVVLGILLIVMGHRITIPIYPVIFGFVAYWWVLHDQVQHTGQPNYLLAALGFSLWIGIAILTSRLQLSFVLAYLGPILVFAALLLSVLLLPIIVLIFLFGIPMKLPLRLGLIAAFILMFVVFQGNFLTVLLFPLAALFGAELGMQPSFKRYVDPLLSAAASAIGGITGLVLLAQVSQAFFRGQSEIYPDTTLILIVTGIVLLISLVFIYRNVNKVLKEYRETDDSISYVKRYRWMRHAVVMASLFIGFYSLYTLYDAMASVTDEENSIRLADLTLDQLNPFVIRLPQEAEATMDRYSDYFTTPNDITQGVTLPVHSFESAQPVYACPQNTCDLLTTIQPARAFFVLSTVSCSNETTYDTPPFCQGGQHNAWLEVVVDYRIGYVPLPNR